MGLRVGFITCNETCGTNSACAGAESIPHRRSCEYAAQFHGLQAAAQPSSEHRGIPSFSETVTSRDGTDLALQAARHSMMPSSQENGACLQGASSTSTRFCFSFQPCPAGAKDAVSSQTSILSPHAMSFSAVKCSVSCRRVLSHARARPVFFSRTVHAVTRVQLAGRIEGTVRAVHRAGCLSQAESVRAEYYIPDA